MEPEASTDPNMFGWLQALVGVVGAALAAYGGYRVQASQSKATREGALQSRDEAQISREAAFHARMESHIDRLQAELDSVQGELDGLRAELEKERERRLRAEVERDQLQQQLRQQPPDP